MKNRKSLSIIILILVCVFLTYKLIDINKKLEETHIDETANRVHNEFIIYNYSLESFERALNTDNYEEVLHESGYVSFIGNQSYNQDLYSKRIQLQKNIRDAVKELEDNMNSEKKEELRKIVGVVREKLDKIVYEQNVATDERLNNLEGFLDDFNNALSIYLSE